MPKVIFGTDLMKLKSRRASVVPYVVIGGKIYLLYGIHSSTGEICDMGGGVKKYESSLSAGIREFKEESRGVLGGVCMSPSLGLHSESMSVLYVRVDDEYYTSRITLLDGEGDNELSGMVWLGEDLFRRLLVSKKAQGMRMWGRVKNFYKDVDVSELTSLMRVMEGFR